MVEVMNNSPAFRGYVVKALAEAQEKATKMVVPSDKQLMERLNAYVRSNFTNVTKIAAIKYVRQFAADNVNYLSADSYARINGLLGAKTFVENILSW